MRCSWFQLTSQGVAAGYPGPGCVLYCVMQLETRLCGLVPCSQNRWRRVRHELANRNMGHRGKWYVTAFSCSSYLCAVRLFEIAKQRCCCSSRAPSEASP